jgi:hypothetical protein
LGMARKNDSGHSILEKPARLHFRRW